MLKWNQMKSIELNWHQVNSNEIKWVQMKCIETKWIRMKTKWIRWIQWNLIESLPPSPQSSYPTLVGFIGIYIYRRLGGNREIVSCRAVRAYVRARGAWSSEISGKSSDVPFPFSLLSRRPFPFPFCRASFSLFPYEHIFPFPLWASWRNGFKWNQVN